MELFIKEAEAHGITTESIRGMVQRDIEYKEDIYNKMRWMKIRQMVTLMVGICIFIMMGLILMRVEQNVQNIEDLIKVLIGAFSEVDSA